MQCSNNELLLVKHFKTTKPFSNLSSFTTGIRAYILRKWHIDNGLRSVFYVFEKSIWSNQKISTFFIAVC